MDIITIILSFILTSIVFLFVDLVWLGIIAKDLYRKYLGSFLSENVNWTAAIIFYCIYIIGISIFAIYPSVEKDSILSAITLGALFGFFAYSTYDLTNLATLKGWPLPIVIIDIIWGSFLTAIVSAAGFNVVKIIS